MNLSTMKNAKELSPLAGAISNRTKPTEFTLTKVIETSEVYFQSMLAFELIGVAATLAGCCVAGIAIFKQQPLAVLVAAFTMFFSGMFMLVGHSMMLSIHTSKNNNNESSGGGWHHGWSFIVAWLAFGLCLVAGVINCIVYRNFRKMSEELTGTPSRVKYANRPHPPVNLGSSI
ncbi:uncharacterized protein LOC117293149 isoform X1 [Asterias rubens]|uniref:uncharacterized protein LOC117293149 isoform X1 n=1 Tax=Asterias rubens TaxID=7604 RepID=UPI001455D6DD|nr:uncharacterized protein LOC117293149 isoform X1 [Asterias rubens]